MGGGNNYFDHVVTSLDGDSVPDSVARRQANYEMLAGRVDAGIDPEYISLFENFQSMQHAEIYRMAQSISPVAMTTLATRWTELGRGFSVTVAWGTMLIRKLIDEHWEGDAGDAAANATLRFGESAQQLSDASRAVAEKLRMAADIGERVRSSVLPPPPQVPMPMDPFDPTAQADAARRAETARAQAVRVMEAIYKPYYRDSGSAVPVLPRPYDGTGDPVGTSAADLGSHTRGAPDSTRSGSAAGSVDQGLGNGAHTTSDMAPEPDHTGIAADGSAATGQTRDDESFSPPPDGEGRSLPAATTPAATTLGNIGPAGSGYGGPAGQPYGSGGGYTPSGGGGGSYGGAGGGGSAALGAGPLGAGPLAAGTAAPSTAAGPASGSRAAGMRPMGMMPGMMSPTASRGDEQDRKVPSYLVTNDNGNELIGALPDTAPPVLGADPL